MSRYLFKVLSLFGFAALVLTGPAIASVQIRIDLGAQRLTATAPNGETVSWKISSGRRGYETPTGSYKVYRMEADHLSDEYEQAPMPYSMFFSPRGLAIHGTYERGLGSARSHGCVRLSVDHARQLYDWVDKYGGSVEIYGAAPAGGGRKERMAERERDVDAPEYRPRPRRRPPPVTDLMPENGGYDDGYSRYWQ